MEGGRAVVKDEGEVEEDGGEAEGVGRVYCGVGGGTRGELAELEGGGRDGLVGVGEEGGGGGEAGGKEGLVQGVVDGKGWKVGVALRR